MIWAMAATAALAWAAPDPGLTLGNVRVTHGLQGPVRPDDKVLPGDTVYLCFDLLGVKPDDDGNVRYSTAIEFLDPKGKSLAKVDAKDQTVVVSLGGDRAPAFARIDVGLDTPPGDYTVKVTVKDLAAGKDQLLTHTFNVLPKDFGLVRLSTTADQEGVIFTTVPGCGEGLWVHFAAAGFGRSAAKQPDVKFEIRVLDADGKAVRTKPLVAQVNKDIPESSALVPMQFMLSLNRAGKFSVEVTATDQVAKKTAKLTFPLTVTEQPK
jgi:hypothetical protein